jgi:hypothetical protein
MVFKEYGNYDAVGLADLVRKKQVTARELLDEAIVRTGKVDPQISAVVVKHHDYAQRQIDRGLADGPFTGVPFLLKDLEFLEGTRTTSGASIYKDHIADHTSTLAQRFSAMRQRCFAWPPSSNRSGPGARNCRRFARELTKLSRIPGRGRVSRRRRNSFSAPSNLPVEIEI